MTYNRIIYARALSDGNGGAQILELGGELAGLTTRGGSFDLPRLGVNAAAVSGVEEVGEIDSPNIEGIAALQPDLIVGYVSDKATGEIAVVGEQVADLEAIAPTVFIATFEPITQVMGRFGELLGVEARAQERSDELDARATAIREAMAAPADDVAVTSIYHFGGEGEIRVNGPNVSPVEQALSAVGVTFSEVTPTQAQLSVSFEQMQRLEADVLVYLFEADPPPAALALFEQLAVVQAGQGHRYEKVFTKTFTGLELAFDFLEPILNDPGLDAGIVT